MGIQSDQFEAHWGTIWIPNGPEMMPKGTRAEVSFGTHVDPFGTHWGSLDVHLHPIWAHIAGMLHFPMEKHVFEARLDGKRIPNESQMDLNGSQMDPNGSHLKPKLRFHLNPLGIHSDPFEAHWGTIWIPNGPERMPKGTRAEVSFGTHADPFGIQCGPLDVHLDPIWAHIAGILNSPMEKHAF